MLDICEFDLYAIYNNKNGILILLMNMCTTKNGQYEIHPQSSYRHVRGYMINAYIVSGLYCMK